MVMFRFKSNRVFVASIIIVCAGCFLLNQKHIANHGMLKYYQAFADYIASGFSAVPSVPTFPMWGYGWVWWLTSGFVPTMLMLQFIFCLLTTWLFVRFVEKSFPNRRLKWLRLIVVCSIPWYMYHSVLQPNVIAADLWVLAIILFLGMSSPWSIALSGVCAGLALNFRSDFILLPLILASIWWWGGRHRRFEQLVPVSIRRRLSFRSLIGWVAIIALMLAPWSYHYWRTTSELSVTSSNGGHVLFIGLGQLPGNPWGRLCSDADPQMAAILTESLGADTVHSCSPAANRVLRRAFIHDVQRYPLGYLKRSLYTFVYGILGGFYQGEILQFIPKDRRIAADEYKSTLLASLGINDEANVPPVTMPLLDQFLVICQLGLSIYSRIMLLLGIASTITLLFMLRRRGGNLLITTAIAIVVYQHSICVLIYANPMYFSGSYMFYVVCFTALLCCTEHRQTLRNKSDHRDDYSRGHGRKQIARR